MKCRVFYEIWEMECCGAPFSVGDRVKWQVGTVQDGQITAPLDIGHVDYWYDAHDFFAEVSVLEGTVAKIEILYESLEASSENPLESIAVGGELKETDKADGTEEDRGALRVIAYLAELTDCRLENAE